MANVIDQKFRGSKLTSTLIKKMLNDKFSCSTNFQEVLKFSRSKR